jgi:2-polyprenyl-3-methyl-5-hydroxy-6-metoxy-1,4-benzoquinol methylase
MSKYSANMPPDLKSAIGWMYDYIEPDKTFLDFGCSTGYFGNLIKQAKKNKVYGVEISEDLEAARKVLDGVYSFDLDGEWPKEIYERKYDYLFYGDVIEHLKYPGEVLEKSLGLLKKGGLIFISTPNIAHISIRLELMGGNFDYEPMGILDNTHLKYFTKKSLTALIEDAGYQIRDYTFTSNDYPDSVINKLLAKCGLTPTDKFWELANSAQARAFQHKVIIEPAAKKAAAARARTAFTAATEKPEIVRNAVLDDLRTQVKNLRGHAKEQVKIIEYYMDKTKELEDAANRAREAQAKPILTRAVRKIRKKINN